MKNSSASRNLIFAGFMVMLTVPAAGESAETAKAIVKCQAAILEDGAGLIGKVASVLDRCAHGRLKCSSLKTASQPKCQNKAATSCATKVAAGLTKERGKLQS